MIFLDTSFLIALVNELDDDHARAVEAFKPYQGRPMNEYVVTTTYVIAETVAGLRRRGHRDSRARHRLAMQTWAALRDETFGLVHRPTEDEEDAAFEHFARHDDKDYSLVDCVSFVLMEKLGIEEAFSVDDDFTHRFRAIPGPRPKPR